MIYMYVYELTKVRIKKLSVCSIVNLLSKQRNQDVNIKSFTLESAPLMVILKAGFGYVKGVTYSICMNKYINVYL